MSFPKKKFTLTILFILSYFNSTQLSFADPKNESLAVKENSLRVKNINKESSGEERLLEVEHRNKQLSMANKDLTVRNEVLRKERDFYLKEATVYKEIVEKLEIQKIQTVENRAYANESSGTQSIGGGESVVSTRSYESVSKSQNIEQIGKEEEGIIDYTENKDTDKKIENEDNYIRNLENQLQLVNTMIQNLQKKTSSANFSPLDSLSIIIKEQKEFQEEHKLLQEKCTAMAGVYVDNLRLQEENKRLREGIDPDLEGKISALQAQLDRLSGGATPEENEQRAREISALQAQLDRLRGGANPEEHEQRGREISALQAQLDRLRGGANPEEHEQRVRQIATLQAQLDRLRGGATLEEHEQRGREISALQAEVARLSQRADPAEYAARVREIQERDVDISTLQAEVARLRNGEELAEYGRKIKSLEMEIIRLLGMAVESPSGQTPVWLPLDSDNFFHADRLMSQPTVSEQPLKDSMQLLKDEYDRIKGNLMGLSKLNMKALDELDVNDVTTFDVVVQAAARIKGVRLPLAQECKRLFENTLGVYNDFCEQKKQEIPGLTRYINLQNIYSRIFSKVSLDKFGELMEHFDNATESFINLVKGKASSLTGVEAGAYFKLINWLELEYKCFTLSNFIKRYTTAPVQADKDYNNSPFVLLWQQTGMGRDFNSLKLATTTHHKTGVVTAGLEEQDPFKIFRQKVKDKPVKYSDISENLIELCENMYMMKYLNARWKHLQTTRFDQDLVGAIRGCNLRNKDSKPLLEEGVKATLCSMLQEDFLQKPAIVHATTAKELDDKLRSSLLYENAEEWQKSSRPTLREDLIEIYTTYRGLTKGAFALHAKNPKIKEFHEE